MQRVTNLNDNSFSFTVNASIYSEQVLFKCFYWYGDNYSVSIELEDSQHHYKVTLIPLHHKLTPEKIIGLEAKIKSDLIDFKTRDIVAKETEPIRRILLAKAFATSGGFEKKPPGRISDPVGFEVDDYD